MFIFPLVGSNDFSAYIPEMWANESLRILEENMQAVKLVHTDFKEEFQNYGDTVNTRRPSEFTAVRKTPTDDITIQDASATNVAIPLDQWVHTSYKIDDASATWSFKKLTDEYIRPAAISLARFADRVIIGQYPQFLPHSVGKLNLGSNADNYMIRQLADLSTKMDQNLVPEDQRRLLLSPQTSGLLMGTDSTFKVNESGNSAGRIKGELGELMGFQMYKTQNMVDLNFNSAWTTKTIVLKGDHLLGATTIITDGLAAATDVAVGNWINVGGFPCRVTASSGTWADATTEITLTLSSPLPFNVANNTNIPVMTRVLVNNGDNYAAGYAKSIAFDGTGVSPGVMHPVSMGTAGADYTVISKPTSSTLLLDRGLEAGIANDSTINPIPYGRYNFAFHRDAVAAVIRPLRAVQSGTGALSTTISYNGLTIRWTLAYNHMSQCMVATWDFLMGVKVLNPDLGAVLVA